MSQLKLNDVSFDKFWFFVAFIGMMNGWKFASKFLKGILKRSGWKAYPDFTKKNYKDSAESDIISIFSGFFDPLCQYLNIKPMILYLYFEASKFAVQRKEKKTLKQLSVTRSLQKLKHFLINLRWIKINEKEKKITLEFF